MKRAQLFVCLSMGFVAGSAQARFAAPSYLPVERLVANTEAYIAAHPHEPQGYYTLGRIHYLAFFSRIGLVGGYVADGLPQVVGREFEYPDAALYEARRVEAQARVLKTWGFSDIGEVPVDRLLEFYEAVRVEEQVLIEQDWQPEPLPTVDLVSHAALAIENFERAMDLDPDNGLYYLGAASLYEQFAEFLRDAKVDEIPPALAHTSILPIRRTYFLAYRLAIEEDLTWEFIPIRGLRSLVAYEAGHAYLRLASEEPSIVDVNAVGRVERDLAQLDALPLGPITPVLFSEQAHGSLSDLLQADLRVSFDLDGDGCAESWPWVKPTTGLLVWDPLGRGKITSGRQLFGSASWQLLFGNGYEALSLLDDNRDGRLAGGELDGIAVWFDTNGNGQSEPGEVTSASRLGISAIATDKTGTNEGMPMNDRGILFKDGRSVPSYDWIVQRGE